MLTKKMWIRMVWAICSACALEKLGLLAVEMVMASAIFEVDHRLAMEAVNEGYQ